MNDSVMVENLKATFRLVKRHGYKNTGFLFGSVNVITLKILLLHRGLVRFVSAVARLVCLPLPGSYSAMLC